MSKILEDAPITVIFLPFYFLFFIFGPIMLCISPIFVSIITLILANIYNSLYKKRKILVTIIFLIISLPPIIVIINHLGNLLLPNNRITIFNKIKLEEIVGPFSCAGSLSNEHYTIYNSKLYYYYCKVENINKETNVPTYSEYLLESDLNGKNTKILSDDITSITDILGVFNNELYYNAEDKTYKIDINTNIIKELFNENIKILEILSQNNSELTILALEKSDSNTIKYILAKYDYETEKLDIINNTNYIDKNSTSQINFNNISSDIKYKYSLVIDYKNLDIYYVNNNTIYKNDEIFYNENISEIYFLSNNYLYINTPISNYKINISSGEILEIDEKFLNLIYINDYLNEKVFLIDEEGNLYNYNVKIDNIELVKNNWIIPIYYNNLFVKNNKLYTYEYDNFNGSYLKIYDKKLSKYECYNYHISNNNVYCILEDSYKILKIE